MSLINLSGDYTTIPVIETTVRFFLLVRLCKGRPYGCVNWYTCVSLACVRRVAAPCRFGRGRLIFTMAPCAMSFNGVVTDDVAES